LSQIEKLCRATLAANRARNPLSFTYTRLHAASKMMFLGVISLLTASLATGDPEFIYRVILIGVFLILTTPVSAHLVARAAFQTGEKMENPEAVDESGHELNRGAGSER
jgi:multicomponent Na+:H+ antiporter subunit G